MGIINKGLAGCHSFSNEGVKKYEDIKWNSSVKKKCEHLRYVKRGKLCLLDSKAVCPTDGGTCPVITNTFGDD